MCHPFLSGLNFKTKEVPLKTQTLLQLCHEYRKVKETKAKR